MNPNDVEMVRVYSREVGGEILDVTFPSGGAVEIAVDCEAGTSIFGLGAPYTLTIYVRDLMENFEIDDTQTITGALGGADWPTAARTHEFTVSGPFLQEGHVFNVLAVLTVGAADPKPIVHFAESNMFVMT
jgi:hypothetical protein